MDDDDVCGVCGEDDCPCPVCHGDPKRWLGGTHSGYEDPDTGAITCDACGETSDGTDW